MKKKKEIGIDNLEVQFEEYLNTITSENSRKAIKTTIKRLDNYFKKVEINDLREVKDHDIDIFLKRELVGKSETTISSEMSRIKKLFRYFGNEEAVKDLDLNYFKTISKVRENKYLTPSQIYNAIFKLKNDQDRALVLLCYLNLYDNDFETIRHLKKNQVKADKIVLEDGREIKLNKFCSDIIHAAINEEEVEKYSTSTGRASKPYALNNSTEYVFKSKLRQGGADILPAVTLKKRFDLFAQVLEIPKFSPIMVKNSRYIYDLIRLEYDVNYGMDINQVLLKDYFKENDMTGQLEKLNMAKKDIKFDIMKDIISGVDEFIR